MAPKLTEFEGTDNEILQILKPLWILSQLALRHDWANVDHAMSSRRKLCGNYKRNSLANDNAQSQSQSGSNSTENKQQKTTFRY